MFRWIDTRWTPRAAMDLSLAKEQLGNAMSEPWPHGMRVVRDLQVQPSASPAAKSRACAADAARSRAALPSPSQVRAWSVCALPEPYRSQETLE